MNQQLLEQLPDIHLPTPVSWWPPAPGWWILALLTLAIIIYLLVKMQRRRLENTYRREAVQQLEDLEQSYRQHGDAQRYLQDLVALLRRLVKTAYPDKHWESLPAPQLLKKIKSNKIDVDQIIMLDIESQLYKEKTDKTAASADLLHDFLSLWIQQHRREN